MHALFAWTLAVGMLAMTDDGGPDAKAVAGGSNGFGLSLYGKLKEKDGNLAFSPASVSTAMAMVYAGAKGETATEMAGAMHFGMEPERLHPSFGEWLRGLNGGEERPYQLSVANALWMEEGEKLLESFTKLLEEQYGAGARTLDFASGQARQTINAWVSDHTGGKINDLLQPPLPSPGTSMVLTNAVYFKGDWAQPFPKSATKDEPWKSPGRDDRPVPMMRQSDNLPYAKGDGFQALELPYAGGRLSMVVLLPDEVDGLPAMEQKLSPEWLSAALNGLGKRKVEVMLPRFRVEASVELKEALSGLGMPTAFGAGADFSGMDGKGGLYIDAVVHKAYVDVNEEGTEAAAATAILMPRMAARPQPPAVFRADHPFVFLIRDRETGGTLFLGRVADPTG